MFRAGDQVPVIPFRDVAGKGFKVAPAQIGFTCVKVGRILGFTVMVRLAWAAH